MKNYRLLIFDVDGTLTKPGIDRLLPHAETYFSNLADQYKNDIGPHIALAANQGGVGMRHWMEVGGFGDPSRYPTQSQAEAHIYGVANHIKKIYGIPAVYISFAYQSQKGKWAPTPSEEKDNPRWRQDWRKPAPGMLLAAMAEIGTSPQETLMISNDQTGQQAARSAKCDFLWHYEFFPRLDVSSEISKSSSKKSSFKTILVLIAIVIIICVAMGCLGLIFNAISAS